MSRPLTFSATIGMNGTAETVTGEELHWAGYQGGAWPLPFLVCVSLISVGAFKSFPHLVRCCLTEPLNFSPEQSGEQGNASGWG